METPGQIPPPDRDPQTDTPAGQTPPNRITDRCKNITFPQLRLWTVTNLGEFRKTGTTASKRPSHCYTYCSRSPHVARCYNNTKVCLHEPSPCSCSCPSNLHCVNGDGENGFCTRSTCQSNRFNWHNRVFP